ncbi:MAG: hypothetical protein Q9209_001083 [Squamulea sp. 1 TL-2023]
MPSSSPDEVANARRSSTPHTAPGLLGPASIFPKSSSENLLSQKAPSGLQPWLFSDNGMGNAQHIHKEGLETSAGDLLTRLEQSLPEVIALPSNQEHASNKRAAESDTAISNRLPESSSEATLYFDEPTREYDIHVSKGCHIRKKLKRSANPGEATTLPKQDLVLSSRPVLSIPHKDIPSNAPWLPCAFGTLEALKPWLVGCVSKESLSDWAIHLQIHLGRYGSPSITLRVQIRQGSTTSGKSIDDNMYLRWFAHAPIDVDDLQIHAFNEQSRQLDDVQLVNLTDRRDKALILTCRLQQPSLEEFYSSASWNVLPERVAMNVDILHEPIEVDFLFFADDAVRNHHIPLFDYHIAKGIPILSQYDDPVTRECKLNSIHHAPTVKEVGDGLYWREDGSITQLPKLDKFLFTRQLRVYAALTPIRDAQYHRRKAFLEGQAKADLHLEPYQRQLDAVHSFCNSTYTPLVNVRELLMCGRNNLTMSNVPTIDLRETKESSNNKELFHDIVEAGKIHWANDRQMSVIKSFSKVQNNTLAVVGPSGTGKTKLSSYAIQALLRLDHKVLVCAPSDDSLDKVVKGICDSPFNWHLGKHLLRVESNSAKRSIIPSAVDCQVSQADVNAGRKENGSGMDRDKHSDNEPKVPHSGPQFSQIPFEMTLEGHLQRLANDNVTGFKQEIHDECAKAIPSDIQEYVFSQLDLLFVTLNDAGSQDYDKFGFKPTVVFVADAGRASLVSLFVPLTRFTSWIVSLTSALETLAKFQTNVTYLDTQYRIAPAIARPLSKILHDGGLITHDRAKTDTESRQILRKLTFDHFGIRGAKGKKGSEYMFLDVPKGLSHCEAGSDLLYNYANVKAIIQLVKLLVKEGLPGVNIVILCFYETQVQLILQHLHATNDARMEAVKAFTVDSFHDKVASIVIVDFVQAYPHDEFNLKRFQAGKPSSGCRKPSEHRIYPKPTSFTDPRRVNLALTRAKDGLVVVGQLGLFASKVWVDNGKLGNVLFWMAYDAKEQGLIYTVENIVSNDSHGDKAHGIYEVTTAEQAASD